MTTLGPQRLDVLGAYTLTLKDSSGAIADLSGVASVAAVLSAGPGSPSSASLAASVLSPATAGQVELTVPPAALAGLPPGRYSVFVTGTDGSGDPIDFALDYAIDLEGGVGTALAPARDRPALERALVSRCGKVMSAVGMSLITAGANPDLDDAIDTAMGSLALATLDGIAAAAWNDLKLIAEYRVLVSCRNNWTKARIQVGANSIYLSDILNSLEARIADMEKMPLIRGLSTGTVSPGRVDLHYRRHHRGEYGWGDGH